MATSSPIRIADDVHASAKLMASVMSRSTAQQIAHWARIGRELETSQSVSQRAIALVLECEASYDDLTAKEQAVIRAEWVERMAQRREALDLAAEFIAQGRSFVELDEDGNIVEHRARTDDQSSSV